MAFILPTESFTTADFTSSEGQLPHDAPGTFSVTGTCTSSKFRIDLELRNNIVA